MKIFWENEWNWLNDTIKFWKMSIVLQECWVIFFLLLNNRYKNPETWQFILKIRTVSMKCVFSVICASCMHWTCWWSWLALLMRDAYWKHRGVCVFNSVDIYESASNQRMVHRIFSAFHCVQFSLIDWFLRCARKHPLKIPMAFNCASVEDSFYNISHIHARTHASTQRNHHLKTCHYLFRFICIRVCFVVVLLECMSVFVFVAFERW